MNATPKLVGALGALTILVGACAGGGATSAPSSAPPSAASAAPSASAAAATPAYPTAQVKITFWTKEGEADKSFQYGKALIDAYTAMHPNVSFDYINKDVEKLREDFQTASLAGAPPDLLWTVADHVGVFTSADLIQPVDSLVDLSQYLDNAVSAVQANGKTWAVPISYGNQLMLLYNKSIVGATAPADSDALIAAAKQYTDAAAGKYGLVFNQTESFWLIPFLGGFGGQVFASDNKTPTLDTPEMRGALQFMADLKFKDAVMPKDADYNAADGLFKDGKAAMIINGDWSLGGYTDPKALGDKLGVAPIPQITSTGKWPAPYAAGAFYMIPKSLSGDKLTVVTDFIKFATNKDNQVTMVKELARLPANKEAFADPVVTTDPILKGAADALTHAVPQPTQLEMRCAFDSMTNGVRDMFGSKTSPDVAAIAKKMQSSAETCIAQL